MLRKRLLTALCGIPLAIIAVWFDVPLPWFTVLASIAGLFALLEFYRLTGVLKVIPLAVCGALLMLFFIVYPHLDFDVDVSLLSLLLTASVALPMILMIFLPKQEGLFRLWAWTLTGVLYIGWLLSFLVALRLSPGTPDFPETGRNLVFLVLFTTFGSDTAAYFVGKAIGRHKLIPSISPNKTWEGAIAGVVGAVIVSLLFTLSTPFLLPLNYVYAIILGIIISIFGQMGDLAESMLKRGAGVKDSGVIMPGHGGIMDRLDSILFAGAVVYLYYTILIA